MLSKLMHPFLHMNVLVPPQERQHLIILKYRLHCFLLFLFNLFELKHKRPNDDPISRVLRVSKRWFLLNVILDPRDHILHDFFLLGRFLLGRSLCLARTGRTCLLIALLFLALQLHQF